MAGGRREHEGRCGNAVLLPQRKRRIGPTICGYGVGNGRWRTGGARPYPIAPQYIEKEDKAVIESVRLWRMAQRYGLSHDNKYVVPHAVFAGSEAMQRGFLQGLFSSDGHVGGTAAKGSVRLTSVSKMLLVDVQRLLFEFWNCEHAL